MKRLRTIQVSLVALIVCLGLMSGSVIEPASAWKGDFFDGDAPGQALYEEMVIHPQAVRYEDAVYVVYQGPGLDPYLVVFEDDEEEPRGPYKVGDNPLTRTWNPDDTHGGPALLIDEEKGVVHVFFGAHGTPMKHAWAPVDKVGEAGAWSVKNWSASVEGSASVDARSLTSSVTYPQLIESTDGTAYMFYRFDGSVTGIPKGSWLQARSDDGGANWSVATTPAISAAPASKERPAIQWYAHFEPGAGGRIHAVATVQQVSRATLFDRSGVYYMYRDKDGVWRGPSGRSIDSSSSVPPSPSDPSVAYGTLGTAGVELHELNVSETQSAIAPFSPTDGPFHNQVTCAEDPSSGIAGLLYLESTDPREEEPFEWRFARFDKPGGEWVTETITTTDHYFDAGALEYTTDGSVDAFVVTGGGDPLSGDPYANRGGDIEWWQPSDDGWTYNETVAQSDVDRGVIYNDPQVVVGHEEEPLGPRLMYAEWNNDAGNFVHKIYLRRGDGTTVGKEFFPDITRLDGPSRFETAVAISEQGFPLGSDFVVLASGEAFPDALTASTLAQAYSAPLLLVSSKKGVLPAVEVELKRLKGTRTATPQVFIVGGTQAVTSDVETQVGRLGFGSKRVAGDNRYETAVEVAAEVESKRGREPTHAYVVSGEVFADALAAAPLAATQGAPLLFANSQGLPSATQKFIDSHETITKTVVAGGSAAVTRTVDAWLPGAVRVAGGDRYETAAKLAIVGLQGHEDIGLAPSLSMYRFVVATGEGFADALTGGAYAARVRGPVVLTQGGELTPATARFLDEHAYRVMHAYIAGGEMAVSRKVVDDIATKLYERQYEN